MENEKVKIFLCGEYKMNSGPSNVNRYLLTHAEHQIFCIKSENKLLKRVEIFLRLIFNDITIFSAYGVKAGLAIRILRVLHKKSVYLMHGCVSYENQINKLGLNKKTIQNEDYILHNIDLILCVSEHYMKWVVSRYPELTNKVYYLNSGIDYKQCRNISLHKDKSDDKLINIVAAGGDRNQKNNIEICKAVEKIAFSTNKEIMFNVYGRCYSKCNVFSSYPHTCYRGMVPINELHNELEKSKVFVLNSEIESFGLVIVDALMCGCSILLTKNAGICALLSLQSNDLICDVHDANEITRKIEYVLENPNNNRLLESINFDDCSWERVSERLYSICVCMKYGQNYSSIK